MANHREVSGLARIHNSKHMLPSMRANAVLPKFCWLIS